MTGIYLALPTCTKNTFKTFKKCLSKCKCWFENLRFRIPEIQLSMYLETCFFQVSGWTFELKLSVSASACCDCFKLSWDSVSRSPLVTTRHGNQLLCADFACLTQLGQRRKTKQTSNTLLLRLGTFFAILKIPDRPTHRISFMGFPDRFSLIKAFVCLHASVGTSLIAFSDKSSSTRLVNLWNALASISTMPQYEQNIRCKLVMPNWRKTLLWSTRMLLPRKSKTWVEGAMPGGMIFLSLPRRKQR